MQPIRTHLSYFVRSHIPLLTGAVRRFRTQRYRSREVRARIKEKVLYLVEDLKRPEAIADISNFSNPQKLTRTPIIEINNTCNIDCVMCKTSLATRKKGKMSEEILALALDRFGEMGISGVELHTIGDPLANPNLPAVLKQLRKRRLTTALTTNGLLLHRHWKTLLEYRDVCNGITFSIDGATKETYERIRFGGKWETLLENVEIARRHLKGIIPLRTTMIVSKDNLGEIGQHIALFRHVVEEPSRDMKFSILNSLSPDNAYFLSMNLFSQFTRKNIGCNYLSGQSLYALVDGKVSVCCRDYDGSLVIGDLKQQKIPDVRNSPKLHELRNAHKAGDLSRFPLCDTCYVVDRRILDSIQSFMEYMLHVRKNETADFYQSVAERFIRILSAGLPFDDAEIAALMAKIEEQT